MDLSERDRAILDLEGQLFHTAAGKEQVVRELFDMTMTRYAQIANRLLDVPEAYAYAPVTVKRLRRLRDARRRAH